MRIIETTDQLTEFLAGMAHAPYVTLDTEFLRDQTYYPKLCLIQMAAPENCGMTEPEAFRWIQKSSMDRRTSMRAVAEEVLEQAVPEQT